MAIALFGFNIYEIIENVNSINASFFGSYRYERATLLNLQGLVKIIPPVSEVFQILKKT